MGLVFEQGLIDDEPIQREDELSDSSPRDLPIAAFLVGQPQRDTPLSQPIVIEFQLEIFYRNPQIILAVEEETDLVLAPHPPSWAVSIVATASSYLWLGHTWNSTYHAQRWS